MDFGPVVLRKLYFNGFDAASGPADPLSFVDDVTLEVYFKQTGALFENTYTVATPAGLTQLLRDKDWDILYSPEIFIVNRYDLKLIRETILERMLDDSELRQRLRQATMSSGSWGEMFADASGAESGVLRLELISEI